MTARAGTAAELVAALDSSFFRALAEPSRLALLGALVLHGPSDVGEIATRVPQERSVVSRHLKVLVEAGVLRVERDGRRRVYSVDGPAVVARFEALLGQVRGLASVCCPPRRRGQRPSAARARR